jgi:pimeloyl-ACP methyl ester carboxylesterase
VSMIANAGHLPHIEREAEVAAAMQKFLQS